MNTTETETAARTELVGNVRDLRRVPLAEIIRARTGGQHGRRLRRVQLVDLTAARPIRLTRRVRLSTLPT